MYFTTIKILKGKPQKFIRKIENSNLFVLKNIILKWKNIKAIHHCIHTEATLPESCSQSMTEHGSNSKEGLILRDA